MHIECIVSEDLGLTRTLNTVKVYLLLADKVEHVRRLNNQGRDARARMDLQVYTYKCMHIECIVSEDLGLTRTRNTVREYLLLADKLEGVSRLNNHGREARSRMDLQVYTSCV